MTLHHFSIEVFPPKSPEASAHLRDTRQKLGKLSPAYFSVTVGPGEAGRALTSHIAAEMHQEGISVAPHITCIDATHSMIRDRIMEYKALGIRHLVALRGNLPGNAEGPGDFNFGNDLVEFVRAETGDWFQIIVAAYPEVHLQAKSPKEDLDNFVRKVNVGANAAITQFFYNPDAYFRFVDSVARSGVDVPVIAGIMPVTNYTDLARFSDACGAEIPRWLRLRLQEYGDDLESIRDFGLDVVTSLCERLLQGGAPGFHFFSLNEVATVEPLFARLQKSGYRT